MGDRFISVAAHDQCGLCFGDPMGEESTNQQHQSYGSSSTVMRLKINLLLRLLPLPCHRQQPSSGRWEGPVLVTGSGEAQTEIGFTLDSLGGITGRGHGVYGEDARVLGDPGQV